MLPIERVRGLLPVANIKGIVLDAPDFINDSVNIGTSVFVNTGKGLSIRVKTTSITTTNNKGDPENQSHAALFSSIPNLKFSEHLRVCVLQSRNAALTGVLKSMGEDIIKYLGPLNQWRGNSKFNDMVSTNVLAKLNIPKDQLSEFKRNFMAVQTKKLFGEIDSPLIDKVDDNGVVLKSVPINFDFTIEQINPTHLSYFIIPYLDIDSIAASIESVGGTPDKDGDFTSLGLDASDFEVLGRLQTPLKYDTVFDEGKISGDSFFYRTNSGKVWTGAIHKMPNGKHMTGNAHTAASKYLTVVRTKNVKIQDFRIRKGVTNIPIMEDFQDEGATVRNILRNLQPKNRSLNPNNNIKDSYVSDLFLSTGVRKSSKFMFLVNMDDLLTDNSLYGKLIKTGDLTLRGQVFKSSIIKSLKIYRKTVKKVIGNNSLGSPAEKLLETNDAPVLVASTFQKEGKGRIEPLSNLTEETTMSFSDVGIRSFNVVDRNFSSTDRSQYRYNVEIDIVDRTLDYLRDQMEILRNFVTMLENYQSDILNSTIRTKDEMSNPYSRDETSTLVRNRTVGGYDPRFGNLTPNFAKQMKMKYGADITSGISAFMSLLKIFSEDVKFTAPQQTKLENYLNMMMNPNVTGPTNVGSVIMLMQDSVAKMSSYVGQNVRMTDPIENKPNYLVGFGESVLAGNGYIGIQKNFKNILDLSLHEKGAYDYLSVNVAENSQDSANEIGLKSMGGKEYRGRVVREILKYFTTSQPDLTQGMSGQRTKYAGGDSAQNTGFSFFTPSVVRFNETAIDTLNSDQVENPTLMKFAESKMATGQSISNKNGATPPLDPSFKTNAYLASQQSLGVQQLAPTEQRNFLLENYNLAPTSAKLIPLSERVAASPAPPPPTQDAFESSGESIVDLPSQYPSSFFERIFKRAVNGSVAGSTISKQENISLFDLDQNVNFLKGLEQSKVSKLPNQIKALFISITSGNGNQTLFRAQTRKDVFNDPDFSSSATLKYKLITEVEYLDGFSMNTMGNRDRLLMTAPNFSRLTADAFSTFTGKKVLCRLRKYEIPEWGITRPKLLDALIYDEYFILQPDTPLAGANPAIPDGIGVGLANAGWGLSAEEYSLLAEFGTSFLPVASPTLQSDRMKAVVGKLAGFAPKIIDDPISSNFAPQLDRTFTSNLVNLRLQLQELNAVIAGLEVQLGTQGQSISSTIQKISEARAKLEGSDTQRTEVLQAQIAEFNNVVSSSQAATMNTQTTLSARKQDRTTLLAEIQSAIKDSELARLDEIISGNEYGECPADFQDEDSTLNGLSAANTDTTIADLNETSTAAVYATEPDYEMISKFNNFKSNMSPGDAEEYEQLLAELESIGPEGIQQANEMRTQGVNIFNSAPQLCSDARGRQGVANYLSNASGGLVGDIEAKVTVFAEKIIVNKRTDLIATLKGYIDN